MPRGPDSQGRDADARQTVRADATMRQARLVGTVIIATAVLWLGGQWLGGRFGWDARYAHLMDFAALAGFFWALVVTGQIWRARRTDRG